VEVGYEVSARGRENEWWYKRILLGACMFLLGL